MKKHIISVVLIISILLSGITAFSKGASKTELLPVSEINHIYTLEDGSKIIEMNPVTVSLRSGKTGTKAYYYINNNGITEWDAEITGTFTYNGTTSYCTSSSCTTTVYSGNWHEAVNNASYAGYSAFASVTMELRFLFIVVKTQNLSLTLTCDANGNLS